MPNWWIIVRDIVWTSVFSVILAIIAVFTALFVDNSIEIVVGAGLSSISMAILAMRQ